jgi:hypothetical protein
MALPKPKRSGGRKTAAGKLAVSHNAIKTGAYSSLAVLPGEQESEFQELLQQFQHDFKPQDVAESAMVRELAVLTWKQLRLERMQHTILIHNLDRPVFSDELRQKTGFSCSSEALEIFHTYDSQSLAKCAPVHAEQVDAIQDLLAQPDPKSLAKLKKQFPGLYEKIQNDFTGLFKNQAELDQLILESQLNNAHDEERPYLEVKLQPFLDFSKRLVWVREHEERFKHSLQTVKAQRVMEVMQNVLSARVYEDLQRAFYKTLTELRRHQSWRYTQRTIDMAAAAQLSRPSA